MNIWIHCLLWVVLGFLTIEVVCYWLPLAGRLFRSSRPSAPGPENRDLTFLILTACRNGAACVPGFAKTFLDQDFPPDRVKLFLAADHCTDHSAELARAAGMDVHERQAPAEPGKGNAVNEVLQRRLKDIPFDVLMVLDIDARVENDFLRRASAYFRNTPRVLSCATFAKNPDQTLLGHVGTLIQSLIRLHQEGRAALGLDALIFGSHGYAASRDALDRLGWHTTTGLIAEDMEFRLRTTLERIPIQYAPDLTVYNDVTADADSVHQQRLRWNATYPPLLGRYTWPLLRKAHLDTLFGALLMPTFANLYLYLIITALALCPLAGFVFPLLAPYALAALILLAAHTLYFFIAFRVMKERLGLREFTGFAVHLGIRAFALMQGFFWMRVKDWAPAPHPEDEA